MNINTEFICPNPNCDYRGKPEFENFGSVSVMFLLLLCGILPGVVYLAVAMGKKTLLPQMQNRSG